MKLGVRAHDFGRRSPDELAARIARAGFECVQLAPPKAIAGFDAGTGRVSAGLVQEVKEAFARHGIRIAVLGCYINLADPDAGRRRAQIERFKEHLRLARDLGCPVVGTETGSLHADYSFHPGNRSAAAFATVLAGVRELAGEAERCGVDVGIEAVERYVISDGRSLHRLIDGVASDRRRVIFDAVNLLSADNCGHQDEIVREALALVGGRVAVIHAKDFVLEAGRMRTVLSGQGVLHHAPLVEFIRARGPDFPVLLEETDPGTVEQGLRFWRSLFPAAPAP